MNIVTFLVLNSPIIQHAIVNYVNENTLKKHNLKLTLNSLSLNFMSAALNLNEVSIKQIIADESNFKLSINQISVGFNVAASYFYRKPVITKVLLRGPLLKLNYDKYNNLILPNFYNKNQSKINVDQLVNQIYQNFPKSLNLLNTSIYLGSENSNNHQFINFSSVEMNKINQIGSSEFGIKIKTFVSGSNIKLPNYSNIIKIKQMSAEANIFLNGKIFLPKMNLESNLFSLKLLNGDISYNKNLSDFKYQANIDNLMTYDKELFSIFNIQSLGEINISGKLTGDSIFKAPNFIGNAIWNNVTLNKFKLYSGTAKFTLEKNSIKYKNAVIKTNKNAIITADGFFNLYDHYDFEAKANLENFKLFELLDGFGVPNSPVDFNINSSNINIIGQIVSENKNNEFELKINSDVYGSKFTVNNFDSKDRIPLPEFVVNLNLYANANCVNFNNSKLYFKNENNHSHVSLSNGLLDFSNPKGTGVLFNFSGDKINLGILGYFLKYPTSGIAQLNGLLELKPGAQRLDFKSNLNALNGELFGVKYKNVSANLELNSDNLILSNTNFLFGLNTNENSTLSIPSFKFTFSNSEGIIDGILNGNLNSITSSLVDWLNPSLRNSDGFVQDLKFHIAGPLLNPVKWSLNLIGDLNDVSILNGKINSVKVNLDCVKGVCKNSLLNFDSISANNKVDSSQGKIILQFLNFSDINSEFKFKVINFPLAFIDYNNALDLHGRLDAEASYFGSWDNLSGSGSSKINHLNLKNINFGDLSFKVFSPEKNKIQVNLNAFNNQLFSKLILQDNSLKSNLDISLKNLNLMQIFNEKTISENNMFTQIDGDFHFQGKVNDFNDFSYNGFFKNWSGEGTLSKINLQYQRLILNLENQVNIMLKQNKINTSPFILSNDTIKFDWFVDYDFYSNKFKSPLNLNINLSYLNNLFPYIFDSGSDGQISSKLLLIGPLNNLDIDGFMSIDSNNIALKNFYPNLNNLHGTINFKNQTLQIQKLSAEKGKGEISLLGNIKFKNYTPSLNLHLMLSKANFKIPLPIFLNTDLVLNSDLSIVGDYAPYLMSGDIIIDKLNIKRDLNCAQISTQFNSLPKQSQTIMTNPILNLSFNLKADESINIQSQCLNGVFSTEPVLYVSGSLDSPSVNGTIIANAANLKLLKTLFDVRKAELQFLEVQKFDPNVDIQLLGKVSNYNITTKVNGRLSQSRVSFISDPAVLVNGDRVTESDIVSMISTGQVPMQSSTTNFLSASGGVFSYLGFSNFFDNTLNQTVNTVTGGLVDNVSIAPKLSQNGQLSWRANARRSVSQRLDLGISYENGIIGSAESAYVNYIFNDTVSAISSWNSTNYIQQMPTREFFSGLRFQFGSQ